MRTTKDLIAELEEESTHFFFTALVVGFETETKFVFFADPDRLQRLNKLMSEGGGPVGFVGVTLEDGIGRFYCRPLKELAGEEYVEDYLGQLLTVVKALLLETGKVVDLIPGGGWVN